MRLSACLWGSLLDGRAICRAQHGDQRGLLGALARRAGLGRAVGLGRGVGRGFFGQLVRRALRRIVRVVRLDADGGEACVGGDQRGAADIASLAPYRFALAQVGIDLL
jgi:hypothetical protein